VVAYDHLPPRRLAEFSADFEFDAGVALECTAFDVLRGDQILNGYADRLVIRDFMVRAPWRPRTLTISAMASRSIRPSATGMMKSPA
jgi:hypothetical protein